MKIIFVCGSLEPGKDGVGDYTRRLSSELIKKGVSVGILSFYDKGIENSLNEIQQDDRQNIECYRLSNQLNISKRTFLAKKWIDSKNPEWLSLQFVIYSFNNRGLPFGLGKHLRYVGSNRKWHVMFHETWLGLKKKDPIKYQLIGEMQKRIIKSLDFNLKFEAIHTHTKFYQRELRKLKFKPTYLPIFSNIPIRKKSITCVKSGNEIVQEYTFVVFGLIHPKTPIGMFAKEFSDYFKSKSNVQGRIILIGRSGNELKEWITELKIHNVSFSVLGEKSAEEISEIFQEASFGITTNPIFVVEKSGTVAAMREHNLPILVVSENIQPKDNFRIKFDSDLFEYKSGNFDNFMNRKFSKPQVSSLGEIASKFLSDLHI